MDPEINIFKRVSTNNEAIDDSPEKDEQPLKSPTPRFLIPITNPIADDEEILPI